MTGRAGHYLLASLCCAALLAVVATGGAAAAGPDDYCEGVGENESAIVGGVGDTTYTDNVTLYPGSTLTVGYCSFGEPADRDWLSNASGFEVGERDGHTYPVTITGETGTVDFADHLADGDQPSFETRLVVTVAGGGDEAAGPGLATGDRNLTDTYRGYRSAVRETENATTALNETTSAINADEIDPGDANETVYSLEEEYRTMNKTRAELLNQLRSAGEEGNAAGTVSAAEAVDDGYGQTKSNVTAAVTAYTGAVETTTQGLRSTVRLSVLGSLGVGAALGLVAGAAVPLVAARRVKEKMKLSRDVSYDRKTALIPILLGVVAAVGGAAILAVRIGIDDLLRVIV
ncbi:hypothetical protein C470_12273 [Halorubrum distributum JCM 13561]|uniref:Uncharacterized protein n=1 Tax=Halorubrum distributum JCM 13561 TaxID=1227483 RepID=M0NKG5_9EURY|nr:hypothetical protein [Halorubrum litoreum]EMA58452.1 hypothetical protein C470_12273 [Halorubrum litoreum JCM 13561]